MRSSAEMGFKIVGARKFEKLLLRFGRAAKPTVGNAIFQEAEKIMLVSKRDFVPVGETGNLKSSGFVKPPVHSPFGVEVVMGYGGPAAPYALSVHENPRAGKTGGVSPSGRKYRVWSTVGQWQYLAQPFRNARRGQPQRIARRVSRMLRSKGRNI